MALPHLVHPGVNGFLYPPGDVKRLAAGISTLARDTTIRAEMGRASRKIIAGHEIGRTLEVFEGAYREVTGSRTQSAALAS
jgi:glycosyltransferase involved in cell wall biosynthesis